MKLLTTLLVVPFSVCALTALPADARANDVSAQPTALATTDESETTKPNWTLLRAGIWILGLSYTPAVIVAAESDRSGDKWLYIPVAGPWLDLASRKPCPVTVACSNETTNKVLIIVDGAFQSLGGFNIVGTFFLPEPRIVPGSSSERVSRKSALPIRVLPTRLVTGAYGLVVMGTF